ncbi:MAG: HAMP domain-containing histidine kinase [Candidatus Melainabacteria bacterium]|nr:HAMP domain-containing histidine kinase [Candidatus Melainabacteria bacterium]
MEKLLHFQDEELVGTRLSNHFFRPGSNAPVDHSSTINGVIELVGRKSDGSELNVEFSVVDVSLAALARRLAIVIDITERYEVEKLRQAFVSMVSHDLRTPLTSVGGFLQLLPMGVYGQLATQAITEASVAEAQVEQLIMLINDLLDLEKLEAGKLEMLKTKLILEDIIDAAVETVFSLAQMRGVELVFEGCQIDVFGDSERLKQAISKMLASLIRLSADGETLDIIVDSEQDSKTVQIRFRARRLSFPSENLSAIFEPFQRLEIPSWSGTLGLGLTLSRAIATQHGGVCGAECSASGGGTTLWLQLPG